MSLPYPRNRAQTCECRSGPSAAGMHRTPLHLAEGLCARRTLSARPESTGLPAESKGQLGLGLSECHIIRIGKHSYLLQINLATASQPQIPMNARADLQMPPKPESNRHAMNNSARAYSGIHCSSGAVLPDQDLQGCPWIHRVSQLLELCYHTMWLGEYTFYR